MCSWDWMNPMEWRFNLKTRCSAIHVYRLVDFEAFSSMFISDHQLVMVKIWWIDGECGIYDPSCEFLNILSIVCIWTIPTANNMVFPWPDWSDPMCQATSFRHRDILVFYSGHSLRLSVCLCFCPQQSHLGSQCVLKILLWLKYMYGVKMVSGTENSCSRRKLREACVCTILLQIYPNDIRCVHRQ